MRFDVAPLRQSAILYLYSKRSNIMIDPEYQRMGDVWTLDKRQLLIDSIINEFDIPKLYFHDLRDIKPSSNYEYAIIDGRQRLEAVWKFIDGDFPLSDEFEYLRDKSVKIGGLTYSELASKYPMVKQLFDASTLSVFVVRTDEVDLIEEMFSRLNEAVPLNAAERRNAFGGPLPKLARNIAETGFFTNRVRISNKRYQHRDLAAKILYLTHENKVLDTKKVYIDNFFINHKKSNIKEFKDTIVSAECILNEMTNTFTQNDILLKSAGMVVLYYLLFKEFFGKDLKNKISRSNLVKFEHVRRENRTIASEDIAAANYELLEFDRLAQTPNDAYALKFRLALLIEVTPNIGRV